MAKIDIQVQILGFLEELNDYQMEEQNSSENPSKTIFFDHDLR